MFDKNIMKFTYVIVFFLITGCSSNSDVEEEPEQEQETNVSSIKISAAAEWVYVTGKLEVSAEVTYKDASTATPSVNWTVSSLGSLSNAKGVSTTVEAINKGNINIVAELEGVTSSITIEAREAIPPFSGTIFVDPDIITSSDPSVFKTLTYSGQGSRTMYDRRVSDWVTVNAFLFDVTFDDGLATEVQVNPEFATQELAEIEANIYALEVGRLPKVLRKDVDAIWIHKGVELFGGGNNSILIHTGQAANYIAGGILEETLVHEAAHTSLDAEHAASAGWLASQTADINFISTYARDNPTREDVAESFLMYLAVKYRTDRISQDLENTINGTIPNRIKYFDDASLDVSPVD